MVACYRGLHDRGTEGVGRSTTQAVVLFGPRLASDFFMTKLFIECSDTDVRAGASPAGE
jgi:ABC-type transporter Mla maintaining outer membrane lipid asymmetry permease subunit MlaE